MPKKAPKSAFYFFMIDKQGEIFRQTGKKTPLDRLKDVVSPVWDSLTPEQKRKYDALSKEAKHVKSDSSHRLASDGTLISEDLARQEELLQQSRLLSLTIREYVSGNEDCVEEFKARAVNQVHYIMAFNTLGRLEDTYIPIEIGIAEYSIGKGIMRTYHKVIDYGAIPAGYFREAKQHSEETHQLLFSEVAREKNHRIIFREIMDFITFTRPAGDDELPPIFTMHNGIEQTKGCLDWLSERAGRHLDVEVLRVWSTAQLLLELRQGLNEQLPSLAFSIDFLKKTSYDYTIGSSCDFHEAQDSRFCALGFVKRWCFLICECVCDLFAVKVTEFHIPNRAAAVKDYRVFIPPEPSPLQHSVPRTVRASDDIRSKKANYDSLEDFDDDIASVASFRSIGRGASYRMPQDDDAKQLSLGMGRMNLGAASSNPGLGIGRGRPPAK